MNATFTKLDFTVTPVKETRITPTMDMTGMLHFLVSNYAECHDLDIYEMNVEWRYTVHVRVHHDGFVVFAVVGREPATGTWTSIGSMSYHDPRPIK